MSSPDFATTLSPTRPTLVESLAEFVAHSSSEALSSEATSALIGGGRSSPDRAALHNGALVRYLDCNDSYLAPGETCHPSDNLAAVLAAAEYARADGRTLLTALAVALLDGDVMPAQFRPGRIAAADAQELMDRVEIRPDPELSRRFPAEHGARLRLRLRDGRLLERAKHDYHGFHTDPMDWDAARAKFDRLVVPRVGAACAARIADTVAHLEEPAVADLTAVLNFDREESP